MLAGARELAFGEDADDLAGARAPAAASANARSFSAGSSRAGAIGIARIVRKMNDSNGTRKMRWSITKRIGRRTHAAMTTAST